MRTATSHADERIWHFSLWFVQLLLAGSFAAMGLVKLLSHPDRLIEAMSWTAAVPLWSLYVLGGLELMGAALVSAPAVTRTPQRIVGYTALGFVGLMLAATLVHIARAEWRMVPLNLAIAALAGLVAWGRLTHKPLESEREL
jgi:hypothetical protein